MFLALPNFAVLSGFDIVAKNQKETVYAIPTPKTAGDWLALRLMAGRLQGRVFAA